MFYQIKVPQLGINDKYAKLTKWYVKDGTKVKKGDLICSLETTKVTIDLEAEYDGYIRIRRKETERLPIQETIGYVTDVPDEEIPELKIKEEKEVRATKKAIELAKEIGIDLENFKKKGIIKEKDVYEYVKKLEQVKEK